MLPKVIIHNTISVNGALAGFNVDMDLHYEEASRFGADTYLTGTDTVLSAEVDIPPENEEDFKKRIFDEKDDRPYWVVVDSKGRLRDRLHFFRRMPYIKDIIILISDRTSDDYIHFLKARNYDIIQAGGDYVDYKTAFVQLKKRYNINTLLCDSGSALTSIFIKEELVDEIHLLIAPFLVPDSPNRIFYQLAIKTPQLKLHLMRSEELKEQHVRLYYRVIKE